MMITEVNGVRGDASHMVEVHLVACVSPSPNRLLVSTSCRHYKGAATWNCGCVDPAEFGSGTTFSFLDRFGKVLAELCYDLPFMWLG